MVAAFEDRKIVAIKDPGKWKEKIDVKFICRNRATNIIDVFESYWWQVWEDYRTDDSWRGWACLSGRTVIGCIVLQTFVHESEYFRFGPPISKGAGEYLPATGEFPEICEISAFCAHKCGYLLWQHALNYLLTETDYKWVVLSSTEGAVEWYLKQGFEPVKAYRLPRQIATGSNHHLYRHRIPDQKFDPLLDPPSIMLYMKLQRYDAHGRTKNKKKAKEQEEVVEIIDDESDRGRKGKRSWTSKRRRPEDSEHEGPSTKRAKKDRGDRRAQPAEAMDLRKG